MYWVLLGEIQNWRRFRSHCYHSGRKFAEEGEHLCVDGQKAGLDREDLAEMQVDLRWGKGPGENQLMLSEHIGRALDTKKEWV
jgi:hypothetical protein